MGQGLYHFESDLGNPKRSLSGGVEGLHFRQPGVRPFGRKK